MIALKYAYRVSSTRADSFLQPMTLTFTLGGAIDAAKAHAVELVGCETTIEARNGNEWKIWHKGNWASEASIVTLAQALVESGDHRCPACGDPCPDKVYCGASCKNMFARHMEAVEERFAETGGLTFDGEAIQ